MSVSASTEPVFTGLIAGKQGGNGPQQSVRNPYDRSTVGSFTTATGEDVNLALDAAAAAADDARRMPAYERAEVLGRIRDGVAGRAEELAQLLCREAGKPIKAARVELERTVSVLQLGAEEAKRVGGEVLPLDSIPAGKDRWGLTRRFPLSPVSAITPFNFPILLAAHKIAPAVACGATMVLKPPPQDPLTTLALAEIVKDSGYPDGAINVVPCEVEDAAPLIEDARVKMITFTGSARAGWGIRKAASRKRIALELGGNAGVLVDSDSDLDRAASRCAAGGFGYAGQSCISVQRVLIHEDVFDSFVAKLTAIVDGLRFGDPTREDTDVGPLIDSASADRAESWIAEAAAAGATVLVGGGRHASVIEPTVLADTNPEMKVNCEEVFAPVVTVSKYRDFDSAIQTVNSSPYGLQAGVFTRDITKIWKAFETLEVGGVIANDISTFRIDAMPYGGVKDSGIGREGVRYAIEKMTEMRLLVL